LKQIGRDLEVANTDGDEEAPLLDEDTWEH
jgi:hypothetical protein